MPSDHTDKSVAKVADAYQEGQRNPAPVAEKRPSEHVVEAKIAGLAESK
jgi:hypothetical protein